MNLFECLEQLDEYEHDAFISLAAVTEDYEDAFHVVRDGQFLYSPSGADYYDSEGEALFLTLVNYDYFEDRDDSDMFTEDGEVKDEILEEYQRYIDTKEWSCYRLNQAYLFVANF